MLCAFFLFLIQPIISAQAHYHFIEINLMSIELGSVYTYKFSFTAYSNTTSTAHTGSVYHNCI